MTEPDDLTLIALRADIRRRLQSVCAQWPDADFDEMVERLARLTVKYDVRVTAPMYDRRATERLIAELQAALERNNKARESGETSR